MNQKPNRIVFFITILVVCLCVIGLTANLFLGKAKAPTIIPSPQLEPSRPSFTNCGSANPPTNFSLSLAPGWQPTIDQATEFYHQYEFSDGQNNTFSITCGTGFGGTVCDVPTETVNFSGGQIDACFYTKAVGEHALTLEKTYFETNENTFSFTADLANPSAKFDILSMLKSLSFE